MSAKTLLLALVLALTPFLVSCTDDIVFSTENGHYYQLVKLDKPVTYSEATNMANARFHNSKQGYVVTISTEFEKNFLRNYSYQASVSALDAQGDWPTLWGGAQRRSDTLWVWNAVGRVSNPFFDTSKLTCSMYCNWYNTTSAANFPPANLCLQIYLNNTNGPTPGTWRSAPCTATSQVLVVEYDQSTTCQAGYTYRAAKGWCEDIDECANNANICGTGYQCVNTIGSYECQDIDECQNATICKKGFQCINGNGSYSCVDIDECAITPSVCNAGYECKNTVGSYSCTDINECSNNSTLCKKGYSCENTPGSYMCNDINECLLSPCPFGTRCNNNLGSYTCDLLWYFIQSDWNKLVLDYTTDAQGTNRVVTQVKNPNNITRQLWSYTQDGFIINGDNKMVMDAEGGLVYPGVNVILWPQKRIEEAKNQLWMYGQTSHLWTGATNDNVVMDIYHAQYSPGATICLFSPKKTGDTPEGNANQLWTLIEYGPSSQDASTTTA